MEDNLFSALSNNLRMCHVIVTRDPLDITSTLGIVYFLDAYIEHNNKIPFIPFGYQDFEHISYYTINFSLFLVKISIG
jgi:hypothetical protein